MTEESNHITLIDNIDKDYKSQDFYNDCVNLFHEEFSSEEELHQKLEKKYEMIVEAFGVIKIRDKSDILTFNLNPNEIAQKGEIRKKSNFRISELRSICNINENLKKRIDFCKLINLPYCDENGFINDALFRRKQVDWVLYVFFKMAKGIFPEDFQYPSGIKEYISSRMPDFSLVENEDIVMKYEEVFREIYRYIEECCPEIKSNLLFNVEDIVRRLNGYDNSQYGFSIEDSDRSKGRR